MQYRLDGRSDSVTQQRSDSILQINIERVGKKVGRLLGIFIDLFVQYQRTFPRQEWTQTILRQRIDEYCIDEY